MTQKEKQQKQELFNQGLKKCSKCGDVKSLDEFCNNKNKKNGKFNQCKQCVKKYNKNNNKLFSKNKNYFEQLSTYEDVKLDEEGYILVRCKKCNNYFKPTNQEIKHRLSSINSTGLGDHNLYCSEECKDDCEIFGRKSVTPGLEQFDSRELQGEWAKQVKERDNYTCQICGSNQDLHVHHIEAHAVTYDSWELENGITLCINCHHGVHQLPGCTLNNIKNQKQNCGVQT